MPTPPPKFFHHPHLHARVFEHARSLAYRAKTIAFSASVLAATQTIFPLLRAYACRQLARSEGPIDLNAFPGPSPRQDLGHLAHTPPANLTPREGKRRKAKFMKLEDYPSTSYSFMYAQPPISGNAINGLGEMTPRRAGHLFFGDNYQRAWGKLDWFFQVMEASIIHRYIARLFFEARRRVGPPAARRVEVDDPHHASAQLKEYARARGASLVGITTLTEELRYADFDIPFTHAIAIGIPMDREDMLHTPTLRSGIEIQRAYIESNRIAMDLAEHIRAMGWPARASLNIMPDSAEVLHVPIAIKSGLGQLGKHGSMITPEHGSNVRLAIVLTDLPLAIDSPRDIGVDDFCTKCRVCETNCPPQALSPTKHMVRGVERWYVNFDACAPYFAKTHGCGICIHVCPWSEPDRGFDLMEKLLQKRGEGSPHASSAG